MCPRHSWWSTMACGAWSSAGTEHASPSIPSRGSARFTKIVRAPAGSSIAAEDCAGRCCGGTTPLSPHALPAKSRIEKQLEP